MYKFWGRHSLAHNTYTISIFATSVFSIGQEMSVVTLRSLPRISQKAVGLEF